ncbi:DUF3325 domain-containing protein [Burkholderia glumae]|nr:DUF3325 domain-containing protein [Burkholderia glumae]MCR1769699.1 DUF3325 domain-containing protein [Burkholderia glumae]PJO21247.1 DUF3325 domain-containing protein [Burkholderia glumae AU6208]QHE13041.1 DUF3325 family protein [Burkholderia glumae AU6208]QHP94423.1 DUF3325 domain-containing protein [Burkholderia glumae]QJP70659.1 DUF3325 domain-containing protein [Burkholderia glumae]
MGLLSLTVCVAAFACLALAMERHQRAVFGRALAAVPARALRAAGPVGLLLALWLAVAARGWALGLVAYGGMTSLAAGIVMAALIVRERCAESRRGAAPARRQPCDDVRRFPRDRP